MVYNTKNKQIIIDADTWSSVIRHVNNDAAIKITTKIKRVQSHVVMLWAHTIKIPKSPGN